MAALIILALGLLGLAGWYALRRKRDASAAVGSASSGKPPAGHAAPAPTAVSVRIDVARLEAANNLAAERLWRLAYGAPAQTQPLELSHAQVRVAVVAKLQPETLNPDYFPRRPALLTQLMRAVDDPHAAAEKISRMIAHDPVLTADVLRLANSALYRTSPAPIETIQRAIVVCGVESLRGMLATAMLRPVFRATRTNFPRLPRLLWERVERATRAAELYAMAAYPHDRFEAQLAVLLSALGPLVVYSAALDAYADRPRLAPNPALFVELTASLGAQMSQRIAQEWQTSARLIAALGRSEKESLSVALGVGELIGTLSLLESQRVISPDEQLESATSAGLDQELVGAIFVQM